MPTARNARGVDIIAYSRDAGNLRGLQIKALSKRHPVPLGTSLDKVMGHYWIIVNKVATLPSAFVLPPPKLSTVHTAVRRRGGFPIGCNRRPTNRSNSLRPGRASAMDKQLPNKRLQPTGHSLSSRSSAEATR